MWRWQGRAEADFREEIQANIALDTDRFVAEGLSREEARAAAHRAFGNVAHAQERFYQSRRWMWLEDLQGDIRCARRSLRRNPSLTVTLVLVLGLGLGVNNTFFTMVYDICLRGLTFPGIDRVLAVGALDPRDRPLGLSYPDFADIRQARIRSLEGLAAYTAAPVTLKDHERGPDRVLSTYIAADGFQLIRQAPLIGRGFRPEDDRPGALPVVILGHAVWQTRYGGAHDTVGRTVIVNGVSSTVVGVMPEGFGFPNDADLWLPLASAPGLATQLRSARSLTVFARLAEGATLAEATTDLAAIATRLSHDYPDADAGVRLTVVPINRRYTSRISDPTWIQFIAAGLLVLLVACANVASLLLMHAVRRGRELVLRAALGASRWRIVRQLLVESVCIASMGGTLALGLSFIALRVIARDNSLPSWMSLTLDGRVFVVLAGVCLGTVLLFGLVPALHASTLDVLTGLKDGAANTGGHRSRRWTGVFLATEFGMTMMVVVGLAVSLSAIRVRQRSQVALESGHLLTALITLPSQPYTTPEQRAAFLTRLSERLETISSLSAFGLATVLPFNGAPLRPLTIDGRPPQLENALPSVSTVSISDGYFEALDIALLGGRMFSDADRTAGHEQAIINQRLAHMFFGDDVPLGRRIRLGGSGAAGASPWMTVVGVAPNIRQRTQGLLPDPVVYVPLGAAPPASLAWVGRTRLAPASLVPAVRDAVRTVDPSLPLYRIKAMDDVINVSLWNTRISQQILTTIAVISMLLSAVGLYAVAAQTVADRARDIGLRMALGARPAHVVWSVLQGARWPLAAGAVLGTCGSILWDAPWMTRTADALLEPRAFDAMILVPVTIVLAAIALLACYVPARRATNIDPTIALRCE